uniref:RWD domain-containing protein n=1 Tax=Angiostrongylus cantonensis TaxID=6313 RepID=A0A0K0CV15_ANGCA
MAAEQASTLEEITQSYESTSAIQYPVDYSFFLHDRTFDEALPVLDVDEVDRILQEIENESSINGSSNITISMTPLASAILSYDFDLPDTNAEYEAVEVAGPERKSPVCLRDFEESTGS